MYICCGSNLSLVQILFPLFQTHYHQIAITKTKEIEFEPRIKLNHNIYTYIHIRPIYSRIGRLKHLSVAECHAVVLNLTDHRITKPKILRFYY